MSSLERRLFFARRPSSLRQRLRRDKPAVGSQKGEDCLGDGYTPLKRAGYFRLSPRDIQQAFSARDGFGDGRADF
jgi:hypothetical protein